MAERAPERMGVEQFLAWADGREGRWELVDGVPMAMAGARTRHDQVVVNALASLRPQLRGSSCRVFTGDTGVVVPAGNVRRPDLGIDCGPYDPEALAAGTPKLVVEVLSPSTRQIDVLRKLDEYRALPTIDYVLMIDPGVIQVLLWSRENDGWSSMVFEDLAARIELPNLEVSLSLSTLYEDVVLPPRLVGQ